MPMPDGVDLQAWDAYATSRPDRSVFSRAAWLGLIRQATGFPLHIQVVGEPGAIQAGVPLFETSSILFGRRLTNNPFSLYGDLFADGPEEAFTLLRNCRVLARGLGIKSVLLRSYQQLSCEAVQKAGFEAVQQRVVPVLALEESYERVFSRYKKQFRTNLRQIWRSIELDGRYVWGVETGDEAWRQFHDVLCMLFKNKHNMLATPMHFFAGLRAAMTAGAQLHTLRHNGRTVAGVVVLREGARAYYAWSATDLAYEAQGAGTFLVDKVIECLCGQGVDHFDLGVTHPASKQLLFFKTRWGSTLTSPTLYRYSDSPSQGADVSAETSFRAARKIISFMPLCAFKTLSRLAYPHLA